MQAKELIDNSIDIFEGGLGYGTINSILNSVSKEIQLRDYLIGLPSAHGLTRSAEFLSYLSTNLSADISYPIDSKPVHKVIKVNSPATYGSTKIYLQANGYSPMVVIKDGKGKTTFEGAVPFLPQDGNLTSTGAIKLPDMNPQIGIVATFTPTYSMSGKRGAFSSYPEVLDPRLVFSIWQGNLGLDTGIPQSVYRVDTSKMTRIGLKSLKVGESYNFNSGSITFAGWKPWVNIEVGRDR